MKALRRLFCAILLFAWPCLLSANSVVTITATGTFSDVYLALGPHMLTEYTDIPFTFVMTGNSSPGMLLAPSTAEFDDFSRGTLSFDTPSGATQVLIGAGSLFQSASGWVFGDEESLEGFIALPSGYVTDVTKLSALPETATSGRLDIDAWADIGSASGAITSVQVVVPDAPSTLKCLLGALGCFGFYAVRLKRV